MSMRLGSGSKSTPKTLKTPVSPNTPKTEWFKRFGMSLVVVTALMVSGVSSAAVSSEPDYDKLAQAIWLAEGGTKAKKPFGILSVTCNGYTHCRQICLNTLKRNYHRWLVSDKSLTYLEFLQKRYAPMKVSNDPKGLNKNWLGNVRAFYEVL